MLQRIDLHADFNDSDFDIACNLIHAFAVEKQKVLQIKEVDRTRLSLYLRETILSEDAALFFLYKNSDDEPVGVLVAVPCQGHPLYDVDTLLEVAMYGRGVGKQLLKDLQTFAKAMRYSSVIVSCFCDEDEEVLSSWYKRNGYVPVERTFIKKID